jgi:hypothetical protein
MCATALAAAEPGEVAASGVFAEGLFARFLEQNLAGQPLARCLLLNSASDLADIGGLRFFA